MVWIRTLTKLYLSSTELGTASPSCSPFYCCICKDVKDDMCQMTHILNTDKGVFLEVLQPVLFARPGSADLNFLAYTHPMGFLKVSGST